MIRRLNSAAVPLILCLAVAVQAGDWAQWRGPYFNGASDETDLPDHLDLEKATWVAPLPGPSGATAVISSGRVFVSSMVSGGDEFVAICLDEKTGERLWQKTVGSDDRRYPRNNLCSPSPVADGEKAVFTYGTGHITCFDYAGKQLWARNLETEFGNLALQFGYSNSPLLLDGRLYVIVLRRDRPYREPPADGPLDSFMLAVDPNTGETLWKQDRPTNAFDEGFETYSTPIPFAREGRTEVLNTGADFITANDPVSGRELWRFEYWTRKIRDSRVIPSLVTGDGLIFGTRHKNQGLFALQPPKGEEPARILWEFRDAAPDCCTPLFYKGRLYVLDGMRNGKVVTCLEPGTGRQFWQGVIGGRGPWRASLAAGDDKLYAINETGETVVLQAGDQEFKVLYSGKTDQTPIQSSIAIANKRLFIRTAQNLYAITE